MTTTSTTTADRTFAPREKTDRISGMWLREVRQYPGEVSMSFEDPETLARYTIVADKTPDGKTPLQYHVFAGVAGETSRGVGISFVEALPVTRKQPGAVKDGVFFAFTDTKTRCRYVCYENTLPPRPGVTNQPDFTATKDRSFPPKPWTARRPAQPEQPKPEDAAAAPADPAGETKTQDNTIPF